MDATNCDSKFWEYISQKINRYTPPQNLWIYLMENGLDLSDMPEDIEIPKDIFRDVIEMQIDSPSVQRCDVPTSNIPKVFKNISLLYQLILEYFSCSETSPAPPTLLPFNTPAYSIECKYCKIIFCFCDWCIEWHRAHRTDILTCDETMASTPDGVPALENSVTKNEMPACSLKYMRAVPEAFTPTKGSSRAAGYDLRSIQDVTIPARGRAIIDTGLKIQLPEGCYGRVAPRSGLAIKNFIDVGAGVIDEDYRGVLKVILFNHSENDFKVRVGDRVAQLICEKICYPDLVEVSEMSSIDRGSRGFGSTGMN